MIRFVTDGYMVYEVLAVHIMGNAGIMAGTVRTYVIRPISGHEDYTAPINVTEATFDKLIPVEPTIEHHVADLHEDLERWDAGERPVWMD